MFLFTIIPDSLEMLSKVNLVALRVYFPFLCSITIRCVS